jgi:hypothetical protein
MLSLSVIPKYLFPWHSNMHAIDTEPGLQSHPLQGNTKEKEPKTYHGHDDDESKKDMFEKGIQDSSLDPSEKSPDHESIMKKYIVDR